MNERLVEAVHILMGELADTQAQLHAAVGCEMAALELLSQPVNTLRAPEW